MVELARKLGTFASYFLWCCAVRAHSYEARVMQRTQVYHPKPRQRDFGGLTPKGYARQKERNQQRMRKQKPLPAMVGRITRVGRGGFQFVEHMGDGGVMQGRTVMCGRYGVEKLERYRKSGAILRIYVCKNNNRAPILVSIENLSPVTVENMERNGLL